MAAMSFRRFANIHKIAMRFFSGYVLFQRSISIIQGVVAGIRYGLVAVAGWFARRGMLHVKMTNKLTFLAKCDIDLKAFGRSEF